MSEKRFSYEHLNECQMIFDEKTERAYYFNGEQVDIDDVKYLVHLLNQLNDENKELRMSPRCDPLEIESLVKENQCLKSENEKLHQVLSENEKMLQNDLDMLTKLRRENKKKDIEIKSLNAHITNWLNETKIAKLYENEQYRTETLEKENKQLKAVLKRLYFKTDDKFIDNNDVLYLERLCNDE